MQTSINLGVGPVGVTISTNAYIRAINGIAYIDGGSLGAFTLNASGMLWDGPTAVYLITPMSVTGSQLQIEICSLGRPGPTATLTAPPLPCAVAGAYELHSAPSDFVPFVNGSQFVLTDASIYVNIGPSSHEIRPGTYVWEYPTDSYNVYTLGNVTAHLWLCDFGIITATAISTIAIWTTSTGIPVYSPGMVGTAFAGREPFYTFGQGIGIVTDMRDILSSATSVCDASLFSGLDGVVPWVSDGSSGFKIPTVSLMVPSVCWLYSEWAPLFYAIRLASAFFWALGLFLYARRRIASFGQAGGE